MQRLERAEREDDPIVDGVLSPAKHRLDFAQRAYDLKQPALDVDLIAQWVLIPEQLLGSVVAKDNNRGAMLVIEFGDPSAAL